MTALFETVNKVITFILNTLQENINILINNPLLILVMSVLILWNVYNLIWRIVSIINNRKKTKRIKNYYKNNIAYENDDFIIYNVDKSNVSNNSLSFDDLDFGEKFKQMEDDYFNF